MMRIGWHRRGRTALGLGSARRRITLCVEPLEERAVPTITNIPVAVTVNEGVASTQLIAQFTDSDNVTPANFTNVSIDWGDSTTSAGTIAGVGGSNATYRVTGSHAYADEGSHTAVVSFHDTLDTTDVILPGNTVTISDAPLSPGTKVAIGSPQTFSGTGGTNTAGGAFTALSNFEKAVGGANNGSNPPPVVTGFRTINWDGVALDGTDFGGSTTVITKNSTVGIPVNRFQERGVQFQEVYAVSADSGSGSFVDVNPSVTGLFPAFSPKNTFAMFNSNTIGVNFVLASNHTSTATPGATKGFGAIFRNVELANTTSIEFFNGSTSLGKFVVPPSTTKGDAEFLGVLFGSPIVTRVELTLGTDVLFTFNGAKATAAGTDNPAGGHNLVVTDDFVYAEPTAVPNTNLPTIQATQNTAFKGTVGNFTDANASTAVKDFTATINWGDGNSSTGTVTQNKDGSFAVSGTNTFTHAGSFAVQVQIQDFGGSQLTLTNTANIVSTVPPPTVTPGTANQNFVNQVFLDLLGRAADTGGLGYWSTLLDQGTAKQTVVQGIEQSTEFRQIEIQDLYQHYLKRSADSNGLTSFTTFFQQGGTLAQAAQVLLSSPEYFQLRGASTNGGWLAAVYQDVLGRAIDTGGASSFGNSLTAGASRQQVAGTIQRSGEGLAHAVDVFYQDLLRRHADSSGINSWVPVLASGPSGGLTPELRLITGLLTSPEYASKLQAKFPLTPAVPKDPFAPNL